MSQSSRIPNPAVTRCKSCGLSSHSRKSNLLCPQNPRNSSSNLTPNTSASQPSTIEMLSPIAPPSLTTEMPSPTAPPSNSSMPILNETSNIPRKGLNFTDVELSAIAQLAMKYLPVDQSEWIPLAEEYNEWAVEMGFQKRTSSSLSKKARKLSLGKPTGGGRYSPRQAAFRYVMRAIKEAAEFLTVYSSSEENQVEAAAIPVESRHYFDGSLARLSNISYPSDSSSSISSTSSTSSSTNSSSSSSSSSSASSSSSSSSAQEDPSTLLTPPAAIVSPDLAPETASQAGSTPQPQKRLRRRSTTDNSELVIQMRALVQTLGALVSRISPASTPGQPM